MKLDIPFKYLAELLDERVNHHGDRNSLCYVEDDLYAAAEYSVSQRYHNVNLPEPNLLWRGYPIAPTSAWETHIEKAGYLAKRLDSCRCKCCCCCHTP